MLGIVVMVTGIITAIVLSFKYVSWGGGNGQRGCGVPRVFPAGCPQGWYRQGGLGGPPLRWEAGCGAGDGRGSLPAGRGRVGVSIGGISSGAGRGRDLPCLAAARQHPAHAARLPSFPAQVPWLHMLYAAIGAIAFTLVS